MSHANERIITYSVVGSFRLWPIPFKNSCLANCPESRASTDLWRAGLPRAGRRSRPNSLTTVCQIHRGGWFWGCYATQRGTSPLATGGLTAGFSWRAGLPRAGRRSRPNSLTTVCQVYRGGCFRGCCAVQREDPLSASRHRPTRIKTCRHAVGGPPPDARASALYQAAISPPYLQGIPLDLIHIGRSPRHASA